MRRLATLFLAALLSACTTATTPLDSITAEDLAAHIKTLASDEFGGRAPASPGEKKTIEYLRDHFGRLGLQPGNGDSYLQQVPLVEMSNQAQAPLRISAGETVLTLDFGTQAVTWTKRVVEETALRDSELVFVGYGIVAPEYDWNDYADVDVKGKTVVMLVNDPGFATGDPELFNGERMTYYGRWTYKFEEAARQGAAGAIMVHETVAAGYPWDVVTGSWTGAQFDLQSEGGNAERAAVEGWITADAARELFALSGLEFDTLKAKAATATFEPRALNATASTETRNIIRESLSNNVIAILPGSARPDEYIFYTAHWDHLGTHPELQDDPIFNGARDNATGTASLIELAEAFTMMDPAPERSIVFLAVTAEESGLLGSRWYTEHPVYPLAQTVGGINMDSLNVMGPTRDITVVGHGNSELEDYLAAAADALGREPVPEDTPEKGFYYRSDHFNFAKKGVPMLYTHSGIDHAEHGKKWGREWLADYIATRYHKPGDEYSPDWDLSGAAADVRLFFLIGQMLSMETAWPDWYPNNEFRAVREASRRAAQNP